jgi:N-acetylglucosamine kinase-like BadF-type ATPase
MPPVPSDPRLFLGVDGGQSHTEAVVADVDGRVLGRGHGGPSNHVEAPGGRERLTRAVIESVGGALAAAGLGQMASTRFTAAHFAMTGEADFKHDIVASVVQADRLDVSHDAPAALAGATAGRAGIVVIAGTGCVAYGENAAGQSMRCGGFGFVFGDEGGAFGLARDTSRACMRALDRGMPPTPLVHTLCARFGVDDLRLMPMRFYNAKLSRDEVAAAARDVLEAAEQGDALAMGAVEAGVASLVDLVHAVARALHMEAPDVRRAGGLFGNARWQATFDAQLAQELPRAIPAAPQLGPSEGAVLLALRAASVAITPGIVARLEDAREVRA